MSDNKIGAEISGNDKGFQAAIARCKVAVSAFGKKALDVFSKLGLATDFVKRAFAAAKDAFKFEDVAARLAPALGDMDEAKLLADNLRKSAANGTMSFDELASAAQRLSSVLKNRKDIEAWVNIFHDLSAGTGLDMNELIGGFTKAKASGFFKAQFLDAFAMKGVNLYAPLSAQLGASEASVFDEGAVAFPFFFRGALVGVAEGSFVDEGDGVFGPGFGAFGDFLFLDAPGCRAEAFSVAAVNGRDEAFAFCRGGSGFERPRDVEGESGRLACCGVDFVERVRDAFARGEIVEGGDLLPFRAESGLAEPSQVEGDRDGSAFAVEIDADDFASGDVLHDSRGDAGEVFSGVEIGETETRFGELFFFADVERDADAEFSETVGEGTFGGCVFGESRKRSRG